MHRIMFLRFAKTQKRPRINIIIHAIYVGIRMVDNIVLGFLHKIICAKKIHGQRCEVIYPFVAAETTMGSIVHDIKADCSCQPAQ